MNELGNILDVAGGNKPLQLEFTRNSFNEVAIPMATVLFLVIVLAIVIGNYLSSKLV